MQDGFHRKFALVEDVKHELKTNVNHNRLDNLVLIDALQRMGIDYHFQEEIESVLEEEYVQSACFLKYQTHFEVSLCFRLLRQQGYYVPAG